MLTSTQFEAIGRLTLAFNEIEETLTDYLPYIVQSPELRVSQLLGEGETFHRKAELFKKILRAIAEERPQACFHIGTVSTLIDRALEIAKKRNRFVHAVAVIDFTENKRLIRTKKGLVPVDEMEIRNLAVESSALANQLGEECEDLGRWLLALRNGTTPEDSEPFSDEEEVPEYE